MSRYEKIGSFLLFDKLGEDSFSSDFLAGQIVNYQVQNVYVVKKLDPSLLKSSDLIPGLTADYEIVKTLSNPNIIKPNSLLSDKNAFAAVFDHVEGKTLRAVLKKCSQDFFPFSVDHSLLVGSRLCTALEYLHSKKTDEDRLIHGCVCPESIFITYDGEIKLQYFGLPRILMKIPESRERLLQGYGAYIAPELQDKGLWSKAVDVYGAGSVLYEMLTGEPLDTKKGSLANMLEAAEVSSNSGDRIPIPEELRKVLLKSLASDPAQRYQSIADMRKALDLLLFSSEFSPTTFHLAFFMHSLFRENMDAEAKGLSVLRNLDARNFLKEEAPAPVQATRIIERPAFVAAPSMPTMKVEEELVEDLDASEIAPDVLELSEDPQPTQPEVFKVPAAFAVKERRSKVPIFLGLLLVLALAGTLAYIFLFLKPHDGTRIAQKAGTLPSPIVQPSASEEPAVDEEKQKLKQEAEKAKEEALRKDEQLKSLLAELEKIKKAQTDATKKKASDATPAVDPVAIQKLEQEAKRLALEKKQQQAIADQKLKEAQETVTPPVEEVKLQDSPTEKKVEPATEPPVSNQVQNDPSLTTPADKVEAQPQVPVAPVLNEGDLVELTPDVTKPTIINRVEPTYPRRAVQKKAEGTVILRILISEKGDPIEINVLRDPGPTTGFKDAAVSAVKKWKFRPAVKEGKRVKVWMTYPIVFKFQEQ
jgi:TonB family protein